MALMTLRILRMSMIVVKEFTQPVKKLFVNIAQRNTFFRKYIIKPPARGYYWCEKSLHKLISKDTQLEQLTEEGTIDLGAAIWAEIVVFLGCSKVLLVETNKQIKQKEMAEEELIKRERNINESVEILQNMLNLQVIYIEQIIVALEELGFHWCEVTLKMLLLNLGRPVKVVPLNETMALELGAELLGELIVFSVAAAGLIFETKRQAKKRDFEMKSVNIHSIDLIEATKVLEYRQQKQKMYIQEIAQALAELNSPININELEKRKTVQENNDKLFEYML
ncbi:PREDICTED: optic atrophy 3 protein homolog isoform X2 [Bactrocera latifrons]|uniref:optic atrophy 3 protein homolog isoform X2 n=1 Tax=Bactrocera latifrons TaxID=174628 RepID=UPI0008DD6EDA|nr:PREDICTED: optic atrophy 3 protein homolog isoform X2 [Bactrocera latifrons]